MIRAALTALAVTAVLLALGHTALMHARHAGAMEPTEWRVKG